MKTTNPRDKSQSMGLWLNELIVLSPEKLEAAVNDLARSGFGIIRLMLRNTNFTHRSPQVVAAVAQIVDLAHRQGVRVALDCEPHAMPVARDLGELYPEAIGYRVVGAVVSVEKGRFVARIRAPKAHLTRTDFAKVERFFLLGASGEKTAKTPEDLEYRVVTGNYPNGFTTDCDSYVEGRPMDQASYLHIKGRLPGVERGRLAIYANFFDPSVIDFWSQGTWDYYDQLLECYRGIPLDGAGWDEPGIGGNWSHYLFGQAFSAAFERLNGYRLEDNLPLLDGPGYAAENARVRLDYYRTFNEGIFEAQRRLFAKARELFGENLLLGTHHTWQGEGGINDYRAGAVDYFRLNDSMDAGYTDCWWWDAKSVAYSYTLGSSLGRLTPSGEAEINTWDAKPTNARVEFQARLMSLMDLTWFNIWYGTATDTCLYPADYTWAAAVREMNRHHQASLRVGGAKPVVEIAMLHGWETVCGLNRADIASAHKTFCLNTAELFLNRSVAFDWVDTRLIAGSRIEGGRLVNALGSYSVLVLAYASILSAEAWAKCLEFAHAGGKLVFVGTPPHLDTEGASISGDFRCLLEMPELSLPDYLAGIDAAYTLPGYRADILDVHYELEGKSPRHLISIEGQKHGVRNASGNVVYLTDLDPRERLMEVIAPWLNGEVTVHSDSILWRLYRDGARELLICIAKEKRMLCGTVRWGAERFELSAGVIAFFEKKEGRISVD